MNLYVNLKKNFNRDKGISIDKGNRSHGALDSGPFLRNN